jgi:AMIN domain
MIPIVRMSSSAGRWSARAGLSLAMTWGGQSAPPAARPVPIVLTTVSVAPAGPETIVTITANGPLPPPTVGTVDNPPRIFLDFPGVASNAPRATPSADGRLRRVRVAVHSATPLVTRVVLDLTSHHAHRIEQSARRVVVKLGAPVALTEGAASPVPHDAPTPVAVEAPPEPFGVPPVPPLPPPAEPARPTGSSKHAPLDNPRPAPAADAPASDTMPPAAAARAPYKSSPRPPAKDLERYKTLANATIERLRLQQPLIESVSTMAFLPADRLLLAVDELERIRQELSTMVPPETVRGQHELLVQAARLAATAMRLREDALRRLDTALVNNSAAAAAGALLALERACAEIGCPPAPGR